jgi:hypothetical protein
MIKTMNGYKPLARLMKNEYIAHGQRFVRFPKNCFGSTPHNDVMCTASHPLVFDFKCIPASEFVGNHPGVEYVNESSHQYNIMFETHEYIPIEGLVFVSHHPQHPVLPLKPHEYFDVFKYREGFFWEDVKKYDEIFTQ